MPDGEVWLAIGYAGFLLVVARGLEAGARRVGRIGGWPHCDAARLWRALALAAIVVAAAVLGVVALVHRRLAELALIALAAGILAREGRVALARLRGAAPSPREASGPSGGRAS